MTPFELERVLEETKTPLQNTQYQLGTILFLLHTLLRHEADKEAKLERQKMFEGYGVF